MDAAGLDVMVVYADREHSANVSWMAGFDPRFEEALIIVGSHSTPLVLVGNECVGLAEAAPLAIRVELFQDFSLPGQPRDRSRRLEDILASEGIGSGAQVGVAGWKEFRDVSNIEIPSFIVDRLRAAVEPSGTVSNANRLFSDPSGGLRVLNEVEQLAAFEHAACHTSSAVRRVVEAVEPGVREDELVRRLEWNGAPLSCHLMLSSGPRASLGLLSPADRIIEHGDRFTTAYGVWGALNCRAGFVVSDSQQLPGPIQDYVDVLVGPYFSAIADWYECLRVGQTGGVLFDAIHDRIGDPFYGLFLNPGHLIHLDEWVQSPVYQDSTVELRSGMVMQADVIPATGTDYFTTNIEDGLALADAELRGLFADRYPDAWRRVQQRRSFMADTLGIHLHEDVLPFSNIPAVLAPFLLEPNRVMAIQT
jgi:Xaa-Pro aminopeptidase